MHAVVLQRVLSACNWVLCSVSATEVYHKLTCVIGGSFAACTGGFTADNPFPSRYSPAASMSPKAPFAFNAQSPLRTSSPMPGTGLPVVGMVDLEQHRRQLELQEWQQAQQQSAAQSS